MIGDDNVNNDNIIRNVDCFALKRTVSEGSVFLFSFFFDPPFFSEIKFSSAQDKKTESRSI
jgi:hypothetical protein